MKAGNVQRRVLGWLNGRQRPYLSLRMAPMIDVIFLLLIFFLVAAKWRPQEDFLPFQLPAAYAENLSSVKPEPLVIHIFAAQAGCQVQIAELDLIQLDSGNIEKDMVVLMEKMNECMVSQKRYTTDPIEIVCAADVKWQYLAKLYNTFFGAGLTDITFQMTGQSAE